jgi:hypothetical protein
VYSLDKNTRIETTVNKEDSPSSSAEDESSLLSCFDSAMPTSLLRRTMVEFSESFFHLDANDDDNTPVIPDLAISADLFDVFGKEEDIYDANLPPLPLSSELPL